MAELRQRPGKGEGEGPKAEAKAEGTFGTMNAEMDKRKAEAERITKMLDAASDKAPPAMVKYLKMLAPIMAWAVIAFETALPLIVKLLAMFDYFLSVCPTHLLYAMAGLLICFFGGMYPTTIAALEAWQQSGGKEAADNVQLIYTEVKKVAKKSAEDDARDDDGDGIADVDQISGKELLMRKTHLALTSLDPNTLNKAIQGIYTGWMGVLVVLKVQFAKTIALGAAIGSFIEKPASSVATPLLVHTIPKDYHQWIPTLISWTCKSIAISIAWYVQRIISAFHSAIRGGLMFSRGMMAYLNKRGMISINEDESYLDEIVGWTLAALGFYFQFRMNFSVPFPLNIVLMPLSIIEGYIVWTISD